MISPKYLKSPQSFFNKNTYFNYARFFSSIPVESNGNNLDDKSQKIKYLKIYGNMTGMDKIDGMAGETAGLDSPGHSRKVRPEQGRFIYRGGLNLDGDNTNIIESYHKRKSKQKM